MSSLSLSRFTPTACRLAARSSRRAAPILYRHPNSSPSFRHHTTHSTPTSANSSVDPNEVSHFNALASSWWDPHGPSRLLHLMNPLRHDFISRCRASTASSSPPIRYLDIGCGGGIFAESAARLPTTASVTAIDPTPEVLRVAEAHKRRDPALMAPNKLTYLNKSIEELPVPSSPAEGYDVVSVFEVLEHVSAPGPFLERVMQQVRPGGWLVLSTIARTWTSWMVTNVVAEDVLGIVPKGTHEWSKYVNEGELKEWFGRQKGWGGGVGEMRVMGVVYVPGLGWKEVPGGEGWGNYFFGVRRDEV
ncbi:hexaprenyldihydroxybenzoate methyltransferase mitochondrial precursor [Westerdykella ornata]|uniref:Ubiquinone biosynthesis O-methyltransferase, mitochondrial n=1 Tax=Westerdykella ornata TaxID=318751 RepID=A0A6A6JCE6_WESOR|nr:hexaprenyldihydroxybenzoate methyltransferase mitochondrial precursor [Westerdykella ornata]KAF2274102.1 hexaprenyldihydroxybenzoate methyltransferase mitochondrial precursor [Westerdykella ornata]